MHEVSSQLTAKKQAAFALYESGQLSRARALAQEVCAIDSRDAHLWCLLAGIHGQLKQYPQARDCARQAIKLSADNDNACMLLADALVALKDPAKAIEYYQRALEINPENTDASCSLCNVYIFMHALAKARETIETALDQEPEHLEANYLYAVLERRLGNLTAARSRLAPLLDKQLPPRTLIKASNEMGKVLEQLGDYAEAFKCYQRSQQGFGQEYSFSSEAIFDAIYRQKEALSINQPSAWQQVGTKSGRRPEPIFLVGFPRSGTTLLEQILSSHSGVSVTGEAGILNKVIDALRTNTVNAGNYPYNLHQLKPVEIRKLRSLYWEQAEPFLRGQSYTQRLVDKLPLNIIHVPLINRLFPGAHIIFALRDPRDVCLSCYTNIFDANPAMANFSDQEKTARFYVAIMDLWCDYNELLSLNKIEIRYEHLVSDLEPTARTLIKFLGLGWEPGVLEYYRAKNRRNVDTPSYESITEPVYNRSIGRWKRFEKSVPRMLEILEHSVRALDYN